MRDSGDGTDMLLWEVRCMWRKHRGPVETKSATARTQSERSKNLEFSRMRLKMKEGGLRELNHRTRHHYHSQQREGSGRSGEVGEASEWVKNLAECGYSKIIGRVLAATFRRNQLWLIDPRVIQRMICLPKSTAHRMTSKSLTIILHFYPRSTISGVMM